MEFADEAVPLLVIGEAQSHAFEVIRAAGEAIILLQLYVARVVSRFGGSGFGPSRISG